MLTQPTLPIRVKICGLSLPKDACFAVEEGADALGFVLEPSSPRALPDDRLDIAVGLGPYVPSFAVYGPRPKQVPTGFSAVQYVADAQDDPLEQGESLEVVTENSLEFERRFVLKSFRVRPGDSIEEFVKKLAGEPWAHLEAFHRGAYGGTGHRLDWGFAAELVSAVSIPIILAGGLTPENVGEAVKRVRPYGVDVSSGVEVRPGVKDPEKVRKFISEAKSQD